MVWGKTEGQEEVQEVRDLIAPLGPKAICGGLMRMVGKKSVFKDANPRLVTGGSSPPVAVRVSRRLEALPQRPGVSGGYQLRPRVGGYRGRGCLGYSRGKEV